VAVLRSEFVGQTEGANWFVDSDVAERLLFEMLDQSTCLAALWEAKVQHERGDNVDVWTIR
jgi:hypothetical protein